MTRRKLRDMYKIQILSVKRKAKKDKQDKQIPNFKNLEIEHKRVDDKNINIVITDILNADEKDYKSLVLATKKSGSTFVITSIRCPLCNKPIELNKYWLTYICQNSEHEKKNFEIKGVL